MTLDTINKYEKSLGELEQEFSTIDQSDRFAFTDFYIKFAPVYAFAKGAFATLSDPDAKGDPTKGFKTLDDVWVPSKDELCQHKEKVLSLANRVHNFADRLEEVADVFRKNPQSPMEFLSNLTRRYMAAEKPAQPEYKPGVSFMKKGFFK